MEQRVKQRLIGAVVLVALAVIFLPMLLSGPVERTRVDIELDMPPEPTVDAAPTLPSADALEAESPGAELAETPPPRDPDQLPETEAPPQTLELMPAPESNTEPAAAREPTPEADETVAGFYVQVGAFGSEQNAERLAERLRAEGLDVRLARDSADDGGAYRVQVGPLGNRDAAERTAQALAQDFELPGFIIAPQ